MAPRRSFAEWAFQGRQTPMPVLERLTLSPWAKWSRHGRVPWKFITHVILTFLVTAQVSFLNSNGQYLERTQSTLLHMFVPPEDDFELAERGPRGGATYLYTFDHLTHVFNFSSKSFEDLDEYVAEFTKKEAPNLRVAWTKEATTYNLDKSHFGPFDVSNRTQLRDVSRNVTYAEAEYILYSMDADPAGPPVCWQWKIRQKFDFRTRSRIKFSVRLYWGLADGPCGSQSDNKMWWSQPSSPVYWLSIIVVVLATFSLVLTLRAISRSLELYHQAKRHYSALKAETANQTPFAWESLSLWDKLRFFNLWVLVTLTHDVFCIVSSLLYLYPVLTFGQDHHWWVHLTMGIAGMSAWIHVTQYFEYDKELSLFLNALKAGFPYILRLAVAMGPVFIGYALFAWTFFGSYTETFHSFGTATITLFCILNGDDVHATFQKYVAEERLVGRIFLVSFVVCFVYCVLNVFICIMEDAVTRTKHIMHKKSESSIFDSTLDFLLDDDSLAEMLSPFNAQNFLEHQKSLQNQSNASAPINLRAEKISQTSDEIEHFDTFGVSRSEIATSWFQGTGVLSPPEGGLKEPLLGKNWGESEGDVTRGGEVSESSQSTVETQRLIVDHIFHTQARLQKQHLADFSDRLKALEADHKRVLSETNQQMLEMMDRRLHRLIAKTSTSPQLPRGAPLGRPADSARPRNQSPDYFRSLSMTSAFTPAMGFLMGNRSKEEKEVLAPASLPKDIGRASLLNNKEKETRPDSTQ